MQQFADVVAKPGFRRAAHNLGWLMTERVGRLVGSVLVGLLVARHLGPERLGLLSYAIALVTLLGVVPALGLDAIVKRDILRWPEQAGELLAGAFVLRAVVGSLAGAGVWGVAVMNAGAAPGESRLLLVLVPLLLQPALFLPELWLQTQLRARAAAAALLGALAVASAGRIGLILADAPLVGFAWMLVGEMVLGAALLWWIARRTQGRMPWGAVRRETLRRLLRESWPLMFASLAIVVYMKIDEVMLRQMAGPLAVGEYAAAARLSEVWHFLPTALAASVLPALVRARAGGPAEYALRQQQYYDLSAAVAYGLSVPVALAAPWLVRLAYGEPFVASGPILAVHIWSSIFVFIGIARGQWLVNEGLQKFYLAATGAGAVVNVGLNLIFIPRWGGLGAAWATVIAYGVAAWLASYFHPAVRVTAAMQTRALLIPLLGWRYFRRR